MDTKTAIENRVIHTYHFCIFCNGPLSVPVTDESEALPLCGECQAKAIFQDSAAIFETITEFEKTPFGFYQWDEHLKESIVCNKCFEWKVDCDC